MQLVDKLKLFCGIGSWKNLKGEDALTNSIALGLRALSIEDKLKAVWFHVPNENYIRGTAGMLDIRKKHSMGLINGAPDFVFAGKDKTLFIEVKTEKGRQSDSQKLFEDWCKSEGISYSIARTFDDVKEILTNHNLLKVA